jgi:hypothetical protein
MEKIMIKDSIKSALLVTAIYLAPIILLTAVVGSPLISYGGK